MMGEPNDAPAWAMATDGPVSMATALCKQQLSINTACQLVMCPKLYPAERKPIKVDGNHPK